MVASVQARAHLDAELEPELLLRPPLFTVSRDEQLRNPLNQAAADLNPDRPWEVLLGRETEVRDLLKWVVDNAGEQRCDACKDTPSPRP